MTADTIAYLIVACGLGWVAFEHRIPWSSRAILLIAIVFILFAAFLPVKERYQGLKSMDKTFYATERRPDFPGRLGPGGNDE